MSEPALAAHFDDPSPEQPLAAKRQTFPTHEKQGRESPLQASASKKEVKQAPSLKSLPISTKQNHPAQAKNDDDARLIIMVILCFFWFFNLISVYMHDGAATTNFWITLLLDLLIIVGIIFSLLVVLDVVDLR